MTRILPILFFIFFFTSNAFAQLQSEYTDKGFQYKTNHHGDIIATNNPNDEYGGEIDGFDVTPVQWIAYETKCRKCRKLVAQYNETMQDLFNTYAMKQKLKGERDNHRQFRSSLQNATPDTSEEESAARMAAMMRMETLYNELLPELEGKYDQLKLTAKNLRRALELCELQCQPKRDPDDPLVSMPSGPIIEDPALFIDWKGPYYEVCKDCRKQAEKLNEFYDKAVANANLVNPLEARIPYLKAQLEIADIYATTALNRIKEEEAKLESGEKKNLTRTERNRNKEIIKYHQDKIKDLRDQLKDAEKKLEKALKEREKIKKDFDKALADYNECLKKCPPQKQACVFPNEIFESMTVGPNSEVGSSAQSRKELENKAKGAAISAVGSLLGFGGGGGGGGGPKTDRDRSRGDFTRVSNGDTDLDIRASWRNDQLIVSTEIDETPGDGTFHAQWIEDGEGNIYLPVRYLIFKLYRDWKLTVSWTEDHYVNGEHVYHDEGQEVSMGRDLLGTWTLFDGENAATNSIWAMLGFDTAAKGVRHLGAVYDLPPSAFPDDCQLRLVNHISEPDKETVTTVPVVSNLFKYVDESRRKPETLILVQPHIVENAED